MAILLTIAVLCDIIYKIVKNEFFFDFFVLEDFYI